MFSLPTTGQKYAYTKYELTVILEQFDMMNHHGEMALRLWNTC